MALVSSFVLVVASMGLPDCSRDDVLAIEWNGSDEGSGGGGYDGDAGGYDAGYDAGDDAGDGGYDGDAGCECDRDGGNEPESGSGSGGYGRVDGRVSAGGSETAPIVAEHNEREWGTPESGVNGDTLLPFSNIDHITIEFYDDPGVARYSIELITSDGVVSYADSSWNPRSLSLVMPLPAAFVSGTVAINAPDVDLSSTCLHILPGDVNRDATVDQADIEAYDAAQGDVGAGDYNAFANINLDDSVGSSDRSVIDQNQGASLATPEFARPYCESAPGQTADAGASDNVNPQENNCSACTSCQESSSARSGNIGVSSAPADWPSDGSALDWIEAQWVSVMNMGDRVSDALKKKLKENGATGIFDYDAGWGTVVTDFIGVEVCLPKGVTPQDILTKIRDNPTELGTNGGGKTDFWDEVSWPQDTDGRKAGDVVDLNIFGPDNGAIGYIDVDVSDGQICAITVSNANSGTHPVSGVRCWGFKSLKKGHYLFYTTGVDSSNVWGSGIIGGALQRECWTSLMESVAKEVKDGGGVVYHIWYDTEWQTKPCAWYGQDEQRRRTRCNRRLL